MGEVLKIYTVLRPDSLACLHTSIIIKIASARLVLVLVQHYGRRCVFQRASCVIDSMSLFGVLPLKFRR